jgi:uncharacterized protein YgiB involved in biofilm formation
MRRRSTLHITLALAGVMAVAGCSDEKRHVYRSKQDCMQDWGSEKDCEEAPAGSSHYRSGFWYGPRWSGGSYAGRGIHSISSVNVSRGGFGRLGSLHSAFGG